MSWCRHSRQPVEELPGCCKLTASRILALFTLISKGLDCDGCVNKHAPGCCKERGDHFPCLLVHEHDTLLYVWFERPDESHEDLEPKGWSLG
jgi:hypothetical protein